MSNSGRSDQNKSSQKTQARKSKLDRYRLHDISSDQYFEAQQQGTTDAYLVLIVMGRLRTPMYTAVSRPDDTGDDNEDTEKFDADADKMDPVLTLASKAGRRSISVFIVQIHPLD